MVSPEEVKDALSLSQGSELADLPGLLDSIAGNLNSCSPEKESFFSLRARIEDLLFNLLYNCLGPGMTFRKPNGEYRRILISDLPDLADALLFPLFFSMRPHSGNYQLLHSYWMSTGSLSAMRTLYLAYRTSLPEGERGLIERIVQENIPESLRFLWFHPRSNTC